MAQIGTYDYNGSLTPEQVKAVAAVREGFQQHSVALNAYCPGSRELSVAHTNLETASMWAIKAITHE